MLDQPKEPAVGASVQLPKRLLSLSVEPVLSEPVLSEPVWARVITHVSLYYQDHWIV